MTTENKQAPTAATPRAPGWCVVGLGASCWGLGCHVGARAQPWAGLAGEPVGLCYLEAARMQLGEAPAGPLQGGGSLWCPLGFELLGAGTVRQRCLVRDTSDCPQDRAVR